jgi:hypothetical protein
MSDLEIFVISLGSTPRNAELLDQLSSQGLKARLVEAIDGRIEPLPVDSRLINKNRFQQLTGRLPTGPEVGCALSHLKCAKQAQDLGADFALIIEEDAVIKADLLPAIDMLKLLDRGKPTILQLYCPTASVLIKKSQRQVGDSTMFARFFTPPQFAVAYLMNRAAIEIFANRETVEGVADWPPFAYAIEFWGCFPNPVTHTVAGSTIESSRVEVKLRISLRNRYIQMILNYVALFRFRRVYEHSQSLGSFTAYLRYVIVPHSRYLLRYFNTTQYGEGDDAYRVR